MSLNVIIDQPDEQQQWLMNQCNRYANGLCSLRSCLIRGGYKPGVPANYDIATCIPHELLQTLDALRDDPRDPRDR